MINESPDSLCERRGVVIFLGVLLAIGVTTPWFVDDLEHVFLVWLGLIAAAWLVTYLRGSRKMTASSIEKEGKRNLERSSKPRKRWSLRKLRPVKGPSLVDERTSGHH